MKEKPHRFFGLLDSISTPIIKQGKSVDSHLARLGLCASDLDCIFFSHMDFDHTSGLRLVQGAKRIMAAQEEIADSEKYFFRYVKPNWKFAKIEPFSYETTGIGPVGKSYDVFGDGSVVLVNTPGHTHGLFSAVISNGEQYVVLAGDSIYTQSSITEKRLPGFTVDKKLAQSSLAWICQCAADQNCLLVAAVRRNRRCTSCRRQESMRQGRIRPGTAGSLKPGRAWLVFEDKCFSDIAKASRPL